MAHATSAHLHLALPATCQTKICLFCCKVIPSPGEDQSDGYNNNAAELLHRFFKILERQLRTKFNKPSTTESDNNNSVCTQLLSFLQNQGRRENNGKVKEDNGFLSVECCGDCLEVVGTLLKLFHELKCLELKWEWRLDTLLQIMKLGGRVASRQKTLRTFCDNQDNNYFEKSQKVEPNVAINRAGLSSYKRLVSFRRVVIRKCSKRRSKMYPKLILDRLPCHMKVEPAPTPQPLNNSTPTGFTTSVELPPSPLTSSTSELAPHLEDARSNTTKPETDINMMISFILMVLLCFHKNDNSAVLELQLTPITQLMDIETGCDFLVEDTQDSNSGAEIANHDGDSNCLLRRYLIFNNDNAETITTSGGDEAVTTETNKDISEISTSTTSIINTDNTDNDLNHLNEDDVEDAVLVDDDGFIYDEHQNDYDTTENHATPELENPNDANEPLVDSDVSVEMKMTKFVGIVASDDEDKNCKTVATYVADECGDNDNVNKNVTNEDEDAVSVPTPPSPSRRLRAVLRCDKCSKTFSNLKSLEAHKDTHVETETTLIEVEEEFEEEDIGDVDAEDDDDVEMKSEIHEDQKFGGSGSDDETENEEISVNESKEDEVEFSERNKKPGKKRKRIRRCLEKMDANTFSYKCNFPNCTVKRPTSGTLLYHKRKVHQVEGPKKREFPKGRRAKKTLEPLQCELPDCYLRFTLPEELENHSKLHGNFPCGKCDAVFTFAQDLPIHEAKHHCAPLKLEATMEGKWTAAKGFRCLHCEKEIKCKSKWKYLYVNHVLKAHLNLPCATLICPICLKTYLPLVTKHRSSLRQTHFTQYHDISSMDPNDVHRCDHEQCQAYFKTAVQLNNHKYTAHPNQFKCHYCEKTFQKRYTRRKHLRQKHNAVFSFACDIENCETKFPDEEDLVHHKKFYHLISNHYPAAPHPEKRNTEKSVVCEQCGKSFKNKHILETHSLSHSGPDSWQFCCETCGKKCISIYKLAEHERTHKNEKLFQCDICGEKYAHRHNLRNHVNSKHGDITQDLPRKNNYRNLTSRKGIKTGPRKPQKPANQEKSVNKRKQKSNKNTKSSLSKSKADESSGKQLEAGVAPVDANI